MAATILRFPLGRRVSFRAWLLSRLAVERAAGHKRRAAAFLRALCLLDSGSIARAVNVVPTHDRAAARALAAEAIARRAAVRRCGRRVA